MIYLFDESKTLTGTVRDEHVRSLLYDREKNGMYDISAEIPVIAYHQGNRYNLHTATKNAVFLGHYDLEGRFQLHKIAGYDVNSDTIAILGVHLFFDEAKAGAIIKDRRYIDREVSDGARDAFAEIGWQLADYDVSPKRTYNFYNVSPLEARATLIETFGFEFDYWIDFDGKKISGKYFTVKKQIGQDVGKRYTYDKHTNTGHHVLELTAETDYSEVYTAVIGRGRGEEIEDTGGYGRRIEYTDIEWSKPSRPLNKPRGSRVLIDPEATQAFGYVQEDGTVTPRTAVVTFSDIEEQSELIEASYDWLVEHRHPKLLFDVNVADGDGLELGDTVHIKYNEINLNMAVRVGKVIDDLKSGERQVQLGDVAYFKPGRANRDIKRSIRQERRDANSRIYQLKLEFDERFDNEVQQMWDDYEQALIDAHAEIQAAEVRMEALINTTRTDWTDTFNAEVAEIYRKADEDYNRIETEITETIDSTRNEMETNFNSKVNDARTYAEQQAQEKAAAVRTDLETVTSGHQSMLEDLETNVMNIDDFIGPRDKTLQSILDEQRLTLEEKIEIYNRAYPNLLVGTSLGNITGFLPYLESEIELRNDESLSYIRTYPIRDAANGYEFPDFVYLEQGKTYTIGIDFRSEDVEDLDYIYFLGRYNNVGLSPLSQTRGLTADGTWHRYYFTFDWINTSREAKVMIGTNFGYGDTTPGWFDTRQAHLYEGDTHDIPWSPSASDNNQVVNQLLYEVRQLDDGMSTLATKTEVDLLSGNVTQLTNEYQSTSEQVSSKLQSFDDVLGVDGSHFTQIADQVQSKVWMNDVTDINPNLIPFADVRNRSDMVDYWERFGTNTSGTNATALDPDGFHVFRDTVAGSYLALESSTFEGIREGEQYTLSFQAKTHTYINFNYNYTYIINPNGSNHHLGMWTNRKHIKDNIYLYEWIFEARWTGEAGVLIGSSTTPGTDARIRFKEPKLERGTIRTPFLNAFSNIEQMANKIALQVQELDGKYLSQSDIEIKPDYVQLGSQRLGDSQLASIFRVSPDSIEAITDNLNLSGNLNTKGQITALAVDAIEGEFSRLWADEFSAITIDADDINGLTARFEYLYTLNANIEKLVSQNVFANGVNALVGNFVDVNAGNIVTSGLSANVILSSHINSSNALINKIFSNSARIDTLITKTHFANEIKAMSIDAVYANISNLRTKLLTSNVITSNHIKVENALIDKMFASTALIERLTSKSAFIRDIQAIEITANQLNLTTLTNRINQIEGGLRITRPDGVDWVRDGQARGHVPVQMFDSYADSEVGFTGLNFYTGTSHWKTFKYFYTPHEGTRLRIVWAVGLYDGPSNVEYMDVRVRNFSGYAPINMNSGSSVRRATLRAGETTYITQDVPMPPPNYSLMAAYLDFRRAPDGQSMRNRVYARVLHIGQYE